ncbi:type II secretion system F family protein [Arthrobacter sp. AL08]|uniref:type II secretion system F family protein n=1 Tax=unclassified Arthrobacter TaxID=235627 RepID=UPI00249B3E7A|nr:MULTISPECIES: type II secretion system F family protein [unclassified Arthrobacter]MDI3241426.1 type II secretion system F family protein [Arthrobacter sp. AL05]MDI3277317.1 type II secretion system F family protein [Arthrobacter sp. AL08]
MEMILGFLLSYAALGVAVLFVVAPRRPATLLNRRAATVPGRSTLARGMGARATAAVESLLKRRNYTAAVAASLEQAGLSMKAAEFVVLGLAGAAIIGAVALAVLGPLPALILLLLSPFGARFILRFLASRRRAKFAAQLDETLQLLAGGLRAGHSLLRAIDAVAGEAEAPTTAEFARIINETRLGRDLGEALDDAALRMRSEDFSWVAQAIAIHREVGGNLADVLDQVGQTIRERSQIRGQVKALSAEGKISALVLMLLPVAITGALMVISPGYMDPMVTTPLGLTMVGAAAVLFSLGGLWLRKVVQFKF